MALFSQPILPIFTAFEFTFCHLPTPINTNLGGLVFSSVDGVPYVKVGADSPRPFSGGACLYYCPMPTLVNVGYNVTPTEIDGIDFNPNTYEYTIRSSGRYAVIIRGQSTSSTYGTSINIEKDGQILMNLNTTSLGTTQDILTLNSGDVLKIKVGVTQYPYQVACAILMAKVGN